MASSALKNHLGRHQSKEACQVTNAGAVFDIFQTHAEALGHTVKLSVLANANLRSEIISELQRRGAFIACSSPQAVKALKPLVPPSAISYTNTLKTSEDMRSIDVAGLRFLITDSKEDVDCIAQVAHQQSSDRPKVLCHIQPPDNQGKFGCHYTMAYQVLRRADEKGLEAFGLALDLGHPGCWEQSFNQAQEVIQDLKRDNIRLKHIYIINAFPASCSGDPSAVATCAKTILTALTDHLPDDTVTKEIQIDRSLFTNAGIIKAKIIRISQKSVGGKRNVYLNIPSFSERPCPNDLFIFHPSAKSGIVENAAEKSSCAVYGSTECPNDVFYEACDLPIDLKAGDEICLRNCGAYINLEISTPSGPHPLPGCTVWPQRHAIDVDP